MNAKTTKAKSTKSKTEATKTTKSAKTEATNPASTKKDAAKTESERPEASATIPEGASAASTDVASPVRVLRAARCPSMSGESQLDYQVGCAADGSIHLRVVGNTGSGTFNDEWVALTAIREAMSKASEGRVTSTTLRPLYRGRSVNSPAFLLAVLRAEHLVEPSTTVRRCQRATDGAGFLAEVKALVDAGGEQKQGITPTRRRVESATPAGDRSSARESVKRVDASGREGPRGGSSRQAGSTSKRRAK